jgi:hypothetical protein
MRLISLVLIAASLGLAGAALAQGPGAAPVAQTSRGAPQTSPAPSTSASAPIVSNGLQSCTPSLEERERLLSLSEQMFDRSPDGWRVYAGAHCYAEAASLIRDFLAGRAGLRADDRAQLHFHAAQMLAQANRIDDAVDQLGEVLQVQAERPVDDPGWVLYVKGTVGFLRQDRAILDQSARDLDAYAAKESGAVQAGDRLNLNALHGFQKCFGQGYLVAYSSPQCRDFDEADRLNQVLDAAG